MNTKIEFTDIAIIGMSGRFPDAENINELWNNLIENKESIKFFSDEELLQNGVTQDILDNVNYIKASAPAKDIDLFDADFFGFNPHEAKVTDPQHRMFLECAHEALENAGYSRAKYSGTIGIYGSSGFNTYLLRNIAQDKEFFDSLDM